MCLVVLAPARGVAKIPPIGRLVADPREAIGVDEGFEEPYRMAIGVFPVIRDHPGHSSQKVGRKMRDAHPRQNEEPAVVGHVMEAMGAILLRPADKAVPAADVPRRGRPHEAGDRPIPREYEIFQVLPHRVAISQVMVRLDQAVYQGFRFRVSGPPPGERGEGRQRGVKGR